MKKIIFLDIDGVLIPSAVQFQYRENHKKGISNNTDEFGHLFHQPCVDALNYILEQTGAVMVLSSNWKHNFVYLDDDGDSHLDREKLGKFAECRGIKGKLSTITQPTDDSRENQIEEFMEKVLIFFSAEFSYCVLDNECKNFTLHLENKVDIDHKVGLTMENAEQAIRILNKN